MFNGDANGDSRTNNDIAFIPSSADQVIVFNGTYDQLNAFINGDPASSDESRHDPAAKRRPEPRGTTTSISATRVNLPTGGRTRVELTDGRVQPPEPAEQGLGLAVLPAVPRSGATG